MEFSKFEFRSIESFQYTEWYLVWTVQEKEARDTVLRRWSHTHASLGAAFKHIRGRVK